MSETQIWKIGLLFLTSVMEGYQEALICIAEFNFSISFYKLKRTKETVIGTTCTRYQIHEATS